MALSAFAIKLLNKRWRECSIWAIFLSSSFTVSISARFLRQILSAILISEFFILFLTLVNNWIPSTNNVSKSVLPIYPLSPKSFPLIFFNNTPYLSGSLSSTPPDVNTKLRISPLSFMTRCSLKPKNQPIEHLPRASIIWILPGDRPTLHSVMVVVCVQATRLRSTLQAIMWM